VHSLSLVHLCRRAENVGSTLARGLSSDAALRVLRSLQVSRASGSFSR
jgi:hypothetical protein